MALSLPGRMFAGAFIVYGLVAGLSAVCIVVLALFATNMRAGDRGTFLTTYLIAALINGVAACIGYFPVWFTLEWRPSNLSRRRPYLWPVVSGALSAVALNVGLTTALLGPYFGRRLPPGHYGMMDLFASVAAMSLMITVALKVIDVLIAVRESTHRSQGVV